MKGVTELFYDQVGWIKRLPNNGGAWGKAITETVEELEPELGKLEAQKEQLEEKIKQVRGILRGAVKRADKEADMLFSKSQINQAKNRPPAGESRYEE